MPESITQALLNGPLLSCCQNWKLSEKKSKHSSLVFYLYSFFMTTHKTYMYWIECQISKCISLYSKCAKEGCFICLSATVKDSVIRGIYIMHDCIPMEQPQRWASVSAGCLLSSYGFVSGQVQPWLILLAHSFLVFTLRIKINGHAPCSFVNFPECVFTVSLFLHCIFFCSPYISRYLSFYSFHNKTIIKFTWAIL